ncbi:MAG TPA: M67 family metallopeptidase [Mariprofundaceae bacterium]|nr:M67 family metallopeptidase [Mariprofundaceae bacterium]
MNEPARFQSPEYLAVLSPEPSPIHCACTTESIDAMRQAAEQAYPREACGLLIGTLSAAGWNVQAVRQVANLNTERATDRFQLDPEAYRRIDLELRGSQQEIIGVYHSHPDCPAKPSPTDLGSAWEGFVYPIISVHRGQASDVRCWTLGSDERFRSVPLLQESP